MAAAPSWDTTGTSQQVRNTEYPLMDYTDGSNLVTFLYIYIKVGKNLPQQQKILLFDWLVAR